MKDEAGFVTNLYYDTDKNINRVQDALGKNQYWTYSSGNADARQNGNVLTTTDATGKVWTYTYNSMSNPLTVKDPGNTVVLTLDYGSPAKPAPIKVTRPVVTAKTHYTYAATGELLNTRVEEPVGVFETTGTFTYDAYKNLIQSTDQAGVTTSATYDLMGEAFTSCETTHGTHTCTHTDVLRSTRVSPIPPSPQAARECTACTRRSRLQVPNSDSNTQKPRPPRKISQSGL